MTGPEFRAWRRRMGLSRAALLDALHGLGWRGLTIHALNLWATRGPPQHATALFRLMEACPDAWKRTD